MEVTYGLDVTGADERFLGLLAQVAEDFESAFTPGKYLVENFPILRNLPTWFPCAAFHRDATLFKKSFSAVRNEPFDRTLENMVSTRIHTVLTAMRDLLYDVLAPRRWSAMHGVCHDERRRGIDKGRRATGTRHSGRRIHGSVVEWMIAV